MRDKPTIRSSNIYNISPTELRALRVETGRPKSEFNAFRSHSEYKHLTDAEKSKLYVALREKISNEGFSRKHPIEVMLLRKDGKRDKLWQGHHRLAIAIELELSTVPVRFVV